MENGRRGCLYPGSAQQIRYDRPCIQRFLCGGWGRCKDCGRLRNPQQWLQREQTRRYPHFPCRQNANVRYEEKHYGEGNGTGARVLNPVTNIFVGENSVFTLDTAQIKGVDSTVRETNVELGKDAKLYVTERLMTDGEQKAESNIEVQLNGEDSSAQIVSRSVGKETQSRHSIRMLSATANARLISSVILSSWIMQR